jgi:hypothetical protein
MDLLIISFLRSDGLYATAAVYASLEDSLPVFEPAA